MSILSDLIPFEKPSPSSAPENQNDAIGLIHNFLNEPLLENISNISIGGTFPIGNFRLGANCLAKQFWYCYFANAQEPNPKLFLAIEDSKKNWPRDIQPKDFPLFPEGQNLMRPSTTFIFDPKYDRKNISDVKQFVTTHIDPCKSAVQIGATEVFKHAWSFASLFGQNAEGFCGYPFAHFENFELERRRFFIDEFLNQCGSDVRYVRYYFGLDNTQTIASEYIFSPNRIRVILFLVDINGANILIRPDRVSPATMLERSFPPPPYT